MAKAEVKQEMTIKLKLNKKESDFLKVLLQDSQNGPLESDETKTIRESIFNCLPLVGR